MAKDPAILFYPGDFKMGTLTFSREEKGDYIDLICALHSNGGYMSLEDIKIVCPSISPKVLSKLKKDETTGKYYQQRLLTELLKRKKFSESRRLNRLGSTSVVTSDDIHDKTSVKHTSARMENENIIEINKSFLVFWDLYDKKVGREKSLNYWLKLLPEERKACLTAIPNYVKQREKKYRKDPERYLKHRAWEDEVSLEGKPTKPKAIEQALILMKTEGNPDWVPESYMLDIFKQMPFEWKRKTHTPESEVRTGTVFLSPERKELVKQYMKQLYLK